MLFRSCLVLHGLFRLTQVKVHKTTTRLGHRRGWAQPHAFGKVGQGLVIPAFLEVAPPTLIQQINVLGGTLQQFCQMVDRSHFFTGRGGFENYL